jgi:hypothetical protein
MKLINLKKSTLIIFNISKQVSIQHPLTGEPIAVLLTCFGLNRTDSNLDLFAFCYNFQLPWRAQNISCNLF